MFIDEQPVYYICYSHTVSNYYKQLQQISISQITVGTYF